VNEVFVHPHGLNESRTVGLGTRIWAFAHVLPGAVVGAHCNIGEGSFIEGGATLGDHVTVKNGVSVWDRVTVENYVFLGPNAVFTNDRAPRSHPAYRAPRDRWLGTFVREGASIGANATIVCGKTIGTWAFIGAGAVVTKDVLDHALMVGNPAHRIGWVCRCGERLPVSLACSCGLTYTEERTGLRLMETTIGRPHELDTSARGVR
jgi:acetyltransferase-like isoleucine patch superfamily enzyme